jgi:5-methyltetrahydrofolate--homocysteine methyltransferase
MVGISIKGGISKEEAVNAMDLNPLSEAVDKGARAEAVKLTKAALEAGVKPQEIVDGGLVPGMMRIGERFKRNDAFVPEMLMAAKAMQESMSVLAPLLEKAGIKPKYTCVIGTVQGDLHDIGKNLVAMMLRGANFGVIDLGHNVPPERFIEAARANNADVIALSSLLTTTMPCMKQTVEAAKKAGLRSKVIVGGAPVTQAFCNEIGADGYSADAASAVDLVMKLVPAQ